MSWSLHSHRCELQVARADWRAPTPRDIRRARVPVAPTPRDLRREGTPVAIRGMCALIVVLFAAACSAAPVRRPPPMPEPTVLRYTAEDSAWVEETLAGLTLERKVAQLVIPRISGAFEPFDSEGWARTHAWVSEYGVGGVIATIGPPLEAAFKFNRLQEAAEIPLLVTADMEHGPGQLLNGGVILPYGLNNGGATRFPPAMAIGATYDDQLAYELGRVTALEGRAAGVHMTFAPVVDVNNNPSNPIINTRSYGADPELVARMATAHIRGLREHGMLATAKHFPGHGDTGTDSHIDLPVITVDRTRADSIELPPYRAAIDAGIDAVMSAHIAFPAITGDSVPATLHPELLTRVLRDDLGFDGLIITDALDMGAIVRRWGTGRASVLALKAGADLLLQPLPNDVPAMIDAVAEAVRNGELTEARIDESVRRLLEHKATLGLHRQRRVDLEALPAALATREHVALADEAADRSITLVRDNHRLLPIRARRVLNIVYASDVSPFAGRTFQRTLGKKLPNLETARLDPSSGMRELDAVRAQAWDADVVIFSPFIRVTPSKGELAVAAEVSELINQIAATRPVVVTSFGNPYIISEFAAVGTYVVAWGQWDAPQRAAAKALTGQIRVTGKLPIPIPPNYVLGEGIELNATGADVAPSSPLAAPTEDAPPRTERTAPDEVGMDERLGEVVDSIARYALLEGAAPGAAVAIGRHGKLVHLQGYGRLDSREGFAAVTDSSIYDLASLTKVIATTTAVMILVDEGKLDLDAPVSRYLQEWGGTPEKDRVTLRNLLLHNAGLEPFGPLYRRVRGPHAYIERIAAMPLEYEPGTKTVYSDFGPIMLAVIIERVTGKPLDVFAQERIFGPLGMRDTGFNPRWWVPGAGTTEESDHGADPWTELLARIAPTENDTVWRLRHVHGDVHDENAYALGGVAGHAGLFSSARDLAIFAQVLLNGGSYEGRRIVAERTVRDFTRRQSAESSRAVGWDTPAEKSSAGDWFSAASFGHTGFTGTSMWMDPERDVFLVLLTNRVNPTRENQRHSALRRDLADAVQQAITDTPVARRHD